MSGRNEIKDFEDVVKLDVQYIDNWSIGLDIKIILKTIKVVLRRAENKEGESYESEYRLDREYSIAEIIQCNLRKWWLALICAAVCAAVLGGYKYKSLKPLSSRVYMKM